MPNYYKYVCPSEGHLIFEAVPLGAAPPTHCKNDGATISAQFDKLIVKDQFGATALPVSSNDVTEGYDVGSRWYISSVNALYSCTNAQTNAAVWKQSGISQSFDAIVSLDPNQGDFATISGAFLAGKRSVFVRNGVYIETQDIVVPDRGQLLGETPGETIVLMSDCSIRCDGSGGDDPETTGLMSIAKSSTTVTGVGTFFERLVPGQFILIANNYFKIASIQSDTELSIDVPYMGRTVVSAQVKAQSMRSGIFVCNLAVGTHPALGVTTTKPGFVVNSVRHSGFQNITLSGLAPNWTMNNCCDIGLKNIISSNSQMSAMHIANSVDIMLTTTNLFNSVNHGLHIVGGRTLVVSGSSSTCNGECAIRIESSTNIALNDCIALQCETGVFSDAASSKITLVSSTVENNASGILMHSDHSVITSCVISKNSLAVQLGQGNVLSQCQLSDNQIAVNVDQTNCNINGNILCNNDIGANITNALCTVSLNNFSQGSTALQTTFASLVSSNVFSDCNVAIDSTGLTAGVFANNMFSGNTADHLS